MVGNTVTILQMGKLSLRLSSPSHQLALCKLWSFALGCFFCLELSPQTLLQRVLILLILHSLAQCHLLQEAFPDHPQTVASPSLPKSLYQTTLFSSHNLTHLALLFAHSSPWLESVFACQETKSVKAGVSSVLFIPTPQGLDKSSVNEALDQVLNFILLVSALFIFLCIPDDRVGVILIHMVGCAGNICVTLYCHWAPGVWRATNEQKGLCRMDMNQKLWVTQSCPTVCNPVDCSPPGSSVQGILQARILEWVAISFIESSQTRDWTWVSCTAGRFFIVWATREILWTRCPRLQMRLRPSVSAKRSHYL